MTDQNELKHFENKKYRDGYLQSRVRGRIAYQIQALREKLGLTQEGFAELTGKKQSTISRLENTEYGKVTVQTLLDIACASDVALIVEFASYPKFLEETRLMTVEALQPSTIYESLDQSAGTSVVETNSAYHRFLELQVNQRGKSALSRSANDNMQEVPDDIYRQRPRLAWSQGGRFESY